MFDLFRRPQPEEVFTPRTSSVNDKMYVQRPALEQQVINALKSTQHMIIHGESGNGKTWLYQKVFNQFDVETMFVNMATASLQGDLSAAFREKANANDKKILSSTEETSSGEGSIGIVKAGGSTKEHFDIPRTDSFERCLQILRKSAGNRPACLIFDNFEQALDNEKLVKQVSDIIILLDDPSYSKYKVKLAIVGVPNDIKKYFSQAKNSTTLANRLREIQEVARLTNEQSSQLIRKGFIEELKYNVSNEDLNKIVTHTAWVTDGIAQHLQEYCLELANIAELNNKTLSSDMILSADRNWMLSNLTSDYAAIESNMNSKDTKESRRNQTIYALGMCDKEDFKHSDIEAIVRQQFPKSTEGVQLNISQQLSKIATGSSPIIKRTPDKTRYRFVNPKYKMCVRTMLKNIDGERVEKVAMSDL